MHPVVYYVIASLIIGFLGYNRKLGFWGYFFGAILFTPFIGIILLLASDKRSYREKIKQQGQDA